MLHNRCWIYGIELNDVTIYSKITIVLTLVFIDTSRSDVC